jgi:hypothetical protein
LLSHYNNDPLQHHALPMSPDFLRVCKAILLDLGENS